MKSFIIPIQSENLLVESFFEKFVMERFPECTQIKCCDTIVSFKKNSFAGIGLIVEKSKEQCTIEIARVDPSICVLFGNFVIKKIARGKFYDDVALQLGRYLTAHNIPFTIKESIHEIDCEESSKWTTVFHKISKYLSIVFWLVWIGCIICFILSVANVI